MASALIRLFALVAVLMMPFGMQPAHAARTIDHSASMPMQHCPEQAPRHDPKGAFAECTMACSAALPAADRADDRPPLLICAPSEAAAVRIMHGLHPDTATPPPKRS